MNKEETSIDLLSKLLKVVVENTKRNYDGKPGNHAKEHRAVSNILQGLLGRAPTQSEITLAQRY